METAERLDIIETRAHWQRTEGMVIFDRAFRQAFPLILERVDPNDIASRQRAHPEMNSLQLAFTASRNIADQTPHVTPKFTKSDVDELHDNMGLYTHSGMRFGLNEGVDSTVFFPLNLLDAVDRQSPPGSPRFTERLSDMSTVLRRPFFGTLVETAAFTSNGLWGRFASTEFSGRKLSQFLGEGAPHFDFHDGLDGLEFDFTDKVKQSLLASLRTRNQVARERSGIFQNMPESTAMGTTSGCPVARKAPQFTDKPKDRARLQRLAEFYQVTPEELTRPRSESGIVFGLHRFADFLERVEDCL